jgi:hypothetical protein
MLQVTQAPQGPVLVKQQIPISGVAPTTYAGQNLIITIDGKYKTTGPLVQPDGAWECLFVFNQAGNRRFRIEVGNESAEFPVQVVAELSPGQRLQFTRVPSRLEAKQSGVFEGIASGYANGTQLLLRADGRFELARPVVQNGKWQATLSFNDAGKRTIEIVGSGQDRAQAEIEIVPAANQQVLRFTKVPQRLEAQQSGVIEGEAVNFADGTQLLLRADRQYELARPVVQDEHWQATIGFNQAGKRLLEITGSSVQAQTEIEIIPAPNRQPRVSFTNPPRQVKVEDSITLTGRAENYPEGAQLVLRADQKYELARPRVQNGQWQAETGFRQPGTRLIEIIGSDQDKAQITLQVQAPSTPGFQILPRSAWTNNPTPSFLPNLQPKRITLHHTATSGAPAPTATQAQEAARMRLIRDTHLARPYSDIGYHFIIMPSGRVYEGRDEQKVGAHDVINDGLGIAFDGFYTSATITQQQYQTAVTLCTLLCRRYGFRDPITPVPTPVDVQSFGVSSRNIPLICGHRDRVATECPGTDGGRTVRLPEIRQAVKAQL